MAIEILDNTAENRTQSQLAAAENIIPSRLEQAHWEVEFVDGEKRRRSRGPAGKRI